MSETPTGEQAGFSLLHSSGCASLNAALQVLSSSVQP